MDLKKVLIITYYWPPAGGPGVQRVLKFAKYLPEFGWEPIILTVENGEYPAIDESLLNEIPAAIKIYKTKSFEPFILYRKFSGEDKPIPVGVLAQSDISLKKRVANFIRLNLIIPDAKIGWKIPALKKGYEILSIENPDLIFSTSPPPTAHLIAKSLSKKSKLNWVADLRDPWSKIHYYNRRSFISAKLDEKLERFILKSADAVTTVSKNFSLLIESEENKTIIIPNGFDNEDIELTNTEAKYESSFKIAYVGGLNENRFYLNFFEALRDFVHNSNLTAKDIKLTLAGSIAENCLNKIEKTLGHVVSFEYKGYLEHPDALKLMNNANLLLLFTEKVSNYEGHIPGKIFEYLASGKFILGIEKSGSDIQNILKEVDGGLVVSEGHNFELLFKELYLKWKSDELKGADHKQIEKYSRKYLTGQLAQLFDQLCLSRKK